MNLDAKSLPGRDGKNLARLFYRIGASFHKGVTEPGQALTGDLGDQDITQEPDISVTMLTVLWWNDVCTQECGYEINCVGFVEPSIHFQLLQFIRLVQAIA